MQTVFDSAPQLRYTISKRRLIVEADEVGVGQEALMSLQEKTRLRSQAVRSWG